MNLKIVAISDTHGFHRGLTVPDGDVLIHAGDITRRGRLEELDDFNAFLGELPHRYKIVIAGNHDFCFEREPQASIARIGNAIYLQDQALTIDGVKFYGSPWSPWFHDWAFNLHRGAAIRAKWDLIPAATNILITHGPPYGLGDRTVGGELVGCQDLTARVAEIKPRFHIFGHIHEDFGVWPDGPTISINASSCQLGYVDLNPAVVFEYPAA